MPVVPGTQNPESIYDKPAAGLEPQEPDVVQSIYDGGNEETSRLKLSHNQSVAKTPQQAARILQLEFKTGLPSQFIEENADEIESSVAQSSFNPEVYRKNNPKFSTWLAQNPNHYALAREDLNFFGRIEKAGKSFKEGTAIVSKQEELATLILKEMEGGMMTPGEAQRRDELKKEMEEYGRASSRDDTLPYVTRQTGYAGRQLISSFREGLKGAAVGFGAGATVGALGAGAGAIPVGATGALIGGLSASARYAYRLEAAFAYDELRSTLDVDGNPIDAKTARDVARGVGVINAIIETGSNYLFLKMVPGANKLIGGFTKPVVMNQVKKAMAVPTTRAAVVSAAVKMTKVGGVESAEEFIQALTGAAGREVAQAASDREFPPDSLKEDLAGASEQARDAFVGIFFTAGLTHGAPQFISDVRKVRNAHATQNFYEALGEGMGESATFKNLPEKAQEAVAAITKDGPFQTTYIDPQTWNTYWQEKKFDPREIAKEVMGDGGKAYDEANTSGSDIPIPTSDYAKSLAPTEHNKFFAQEIRREPGEMNAREAGAFAEAMQRMDEQETAQPEKQASPLDESSRKVGEDVYTQLRAIRGEEEARAAGGVFERFFRIMGERAGVDPYELYGRYGLNIQKRMEAGEGPALEQAAGAASEDFTLHPDRMEGLQKGVVAFKVGDEVVSAKIGETIDGTEVYNHSDLGVAKNLDFANAVPGFLNEQGEFVEQYPEVVEPQKVTWETIPSPDLGLGITTKGSQEAKARFHNIASSIIFDKNGDNLLAEKLGVKEIRSDAGSGGFEGKISPNLITGIDGSSADVNAFARAVQFIFKQKAVPFFKAIDGRIGDNGQTAYTGIKVTFNRGIDLETEQKIYDLVKTTLTESDSYSKLNNNTIVIVNYSAAFGGVNDGEFLLNLDKALNEKREEFGIEEAVHFRAESTYGPEMDWKSDPSGGTLLDTPGIAGRPDLQEWIHSRAGEFQALLKDWDGENLALREAEVSEDQKKLKSYQAEFDKFYTPSGIPGEAEETAMVRRNLAEFIAAVKKNAMKEIGSSVPNYVSTDLIRTTNAINIRPNFTSEASVTRHESSSAIAKILIKELLADETTLDKPVLMTGGVSGAGKTTAVKEIQMKSGAKPEDYALILDSNLSKLSSLKRVVAQAHESGRNVQIWFVDRDPVEAFIKGVLPRYYKRKEHRIVPIWQHIENMKSKGVVAEAGEIYRDDHKTAVMAIANYGQRKDVSVMPLEKLKNSVYTISEVEDKLNEHIEKEYQEGRLKEGPYKTFLGLDLQRSGQENRRGVGVGAESGNREGLQGLGVDSTPPSSSVAPQQEFTFQQSAPGEPRGALRFGLNRQFNIDLLRQADVSTFFHETGHFFLEVFGDLTDAPEAPQQLKDDYSKLLKWFGVESRKDIKTEHHEQFARGFEAYLMEGKAPNSTLREIFSKFKVWLMSVYGKLRNLNVQLTDEVRGVMDRMLATQEEIEMAHESMPDPLFIDPKEMGMSDAMSAAYIEAREAARKEAEETLTLKVLREFAREKEAWFKEARATIRADIEKGVNAQNIYRAMSVLQRGLEPDGTSLPQGMQPFKLSREALVQDFGEDILKRLPRPFVYSKDGIHHNVAAGLLGFESGESLVTQLANATKKEVLIESLTMERMNQLYPDILIDGRMPEEAVKAIHNEKRAELLRLELEHLASSNMPVLKETIRKVVRRVPTKMDVRAQADKIIGGKKINEIRPHVYRLAEIKAAKEAGEFLAKGDIDGAFRSKLKELLNHELYRSAQDARDQIDEAVKMFRKVSKPDEKLAKSRDMDLVNAARAILAQFGIGKSVKPASAYLEQMRRYDPDIYEAMQEIVNSIKPEGENFLNATVDDFTAMQNTVDTLWTLSRRNRQIQIEGRIVDRDEITAELSARIDEIHKPGNRAGYNRAMTKWEKTKIGLMGLRAGIRRVESWVDAIDGDGADGPFRKYIWNPIVEGVYRYRDERKVYLEKFLDIVKPVEKSLADKEIYSDELQYKFSGKAEILHAILHRGNESNFSKLLRGRGWGAVDENGVLDTSRWDAAERKLWSDGVLTKEDYDFVQATWDLLEELKSMAQKAHKEMYGYYFNEITANEFETPWGKYRGGYVPAVVDTFLSQDATIRQEREALEKNNNSFMFPTTGRGFTKSRVDAYARPLALDLRLIPAHIDKVLRFVNIEPRVKDVGRIIMDRDFRRVLDDFDPAVGGDMLVPWLQRSAQQRVETPSQGWAGRSADWFFRHVRTNTGLNIMVGNVTNALQQFTGFSISLIKVKPKYLRNALWEYVRSPTKTADEVSEKSAFMRNNLTAKVIEIQGTLDDLLLNPNKYEKARDFARRHGYFMQGSMQNMVNVITWVGKYDEHMATAPKTELSEKEAIRAADSAVRETQGSFAAEDLSRIEAGSPFMRAFTMFYSYFNMQANLLGTEFSKIARDMGLKKGAGRMLYTYVFGFMIPAVLGDAIVQGLSSRGFDQDDDDQYLDDVISLFFGAQARTASAMFPLVGPAVMSGINAFNNKWYDDRITTSPAVTAIESTARAPFSVYNAIVEDGSKKRAIRDSLTLLGLLSGLPVAPLARPFGYLADVEEGRVNPENAADFARGLVTGR